MRRDGEFFGDQELELVYIAKRLNEALQLEEQLTAAGVDYVVEPDRYKGGFLFPAERVGAFFYVATEDLETARALLQGWGREPYRPE